MHFPWMHWAHIHISWQPHPKPHQDGPVVAIAVLWFPVEFHCTRLARIDVRSAVFASVETRRKEALECDSKFDLTSSNGSVTRLGHCGTNNRSFLRVISAPALLIKTDPLSSRSTQQTTDASPLTHLLQNRRYGERFDESNLPCTQGDAGIVPQWLPSQELLTRLEGRFEIDALEWKLRLLC